MLCCGVVYLTLSDAYWMHFQVDASDIYPVSLHGLGVALSSISAVLKQLSVIFLDAV